MPDVVKKNLDRIKQFWDKYNNRQKLIFISTMLVIVIFLIILGVVLARPQTTVVRYCTSATEAVEVRELLNTNGISCTVGSDYSITINAEDEVEAQLILGSNNISSEGFSIKDALDGGFSQTESDTEKIYTDYLQTRFASILKNIEGIKDAKVSIHWMDNGSTIFTSDTDAMINAVLTTTKTLSDETIEGIAMLLANNVGSDNTNNVVIMDNKGNNLYSGTMNAGDSMGTSNLFKYRTQLENSIAAGIRETVLLTQTFSDVKVVANIALNYDAVSEVVKKYEAPEGSDEGLLSSSYEVDSSGNTGASGVPGTESNDDDTSYLLEQGDGTTSKYSLRQKEWLQNEYTTQTDKAAGTMIPADSSISVTCVKYNIITEDMLKLQGLLEDMTYEEYQLQNSDPIRVDVDPTFVTIFAAGSGIPEQNIAVVGYEINQFLIDETQTRNTSFILQIVLAALIVALLAFVVFRSARPVAVSETEPELSVEDMLATTRENRTKTLEDIDLQDKSEARKAIEKFVKENPEAVALLLRNWLNDGWG